MNSSQGRILNNNKEDNDRYELGFSSLLLLLVNNNN